MTIGELIERLKEYPQDYEVLVNGYDVDNSESTVYEITAGCISIDDNKK